MEIKVSVIVPVYNSKEYLPQCIRSILNQTYSDLELILVNDGSTDGSGQVCDQFAQQDDRIKVIHQENKGGGYAFQAGYNLAQGEFLLRVDGDDWIDETTCEKAYEAAIDYVADVVFWPRIKVVEHEKLKQKAAFENYRLFEGPDMEWLRRRTVGLVGEELKFPTSTDVFSSVWGKLYRRSIVVQNQLISTDKNGKLNFDTFFTIKAFSHIDKALYLSDHLSFYRLGNPKSITKNHGLKLFERYLRMFAAIKDFISERNLPSVYEIALNNRIALSVINNAMTMTGTNTHATFSEKIKFIKGILMDPLYRKALNNLKINYFPVHWKIFFVLCRYKMVLPVYVLSFLMRRLR